MPILPTERYWRINVSASQSGVAADGVKIAELDFRDVAGVDSSNAPVTSFSSAGTASLAFDDDAATSWGVSSSLPHSVGVTPFFFAGSTAVELMIQADASSTSNAPQNFTVEESLDAGATWIIRKTFVGQAAWSLGEIRLYNITVINSPPVFSSSNVASISEGSTAVIDVTVTDSDGDTPVFSIAGGVDSALFAINSASGALSFIAAPDFQAPLDVGANNIYDVIVQADDGNGGVTAQAIVITVLVVPDEFVFVGIQNNITSNTGIVTANILNNIYDNTPISASVLNRISSPDELSVWQCRVTLSGVDMSSRISGDISVDVGEGAARIASFELMPFTGVIDPYQWIGAAVTIDYLQYDSAGALQTDDRLFTGVVDEPVYDPQTRLTAFVCTDKLQEYFEQKIPADIDLAVGGYYSTVVFSETDDGWAYAQQRMSTQAASVDFNAYGVVRKTAWQAKAVADVHFLPSNFIDSSLSLGLISRRDVINSVNISFSFRFGRKWQRELSASWNMGNFAAYLTQNHSLPNRAMVLSALNSGWDIKSIVWGNLPKSGSYADANGVQQAWGITDELRESLIASVNFSISKRWLQDVTEKYTVTVQADASIAIHGVVKKDESYLLDADVDEAYQAVSETPTGSILSLTRGDSYEAVASSGYAAPLGVAVNDSDFVLDPTDRTEFDNAITTAIAEARVQILKTHRANTASVRSLLLPLIDVDKTADITTNEVTAKGKVKNVRHIMNPNAGSAFSTVEIAIYQPDTAGQVDDSITPPAQLDTSATFLPIQLALDTHFGGKTISPVYDPAWVGYIGNYSQRELPSEWYPREFRVDIPAIEDEAQDAAQFTAQSTVQIEIPGNTLIINA